MTQVVCEDTILAPAGVQVQDCLPMVTYFLEKQPESYSDLWTIEEMLHMVQTGVMNPWFYVKDGVAIGMALFSIQRYSAKVKSLKIEFLTCEQFFSMTKMIDVLEDRARQLGFTFIEAITPHGIAEYAVKKKGFKAPYVYIKKNIDFGRRN